MSVFSKSFQAEVEKDQRGTHFFLETERDLDRLASLPEERSRKIRRVQRLLLINVAQETKFVKGGRGSFVLQI